MNGVHSPIQHYNLFKSVIIVFAIQAAIVLFMPLPIGALEIIRLPVLVLNLIIAITLGWRLYKRMYHMTFTYDKKGFTLKKGRNEEHGYKWGEFSKVSLIRTEYGDFSVRLYRNKEDDFFDLPVSKLKLNPFDFRFEAMQLVSASKK